MVTYLIMNGILSLDGTVSPKKAASSAIFRRTLRKISPKYIPDMIFSRIWKKRKKKKTENLTLVTGVGIAICNDKPQLKKLVPVRLGSDSRNPACDQTLLTGDVMI